MKDILVQFQQMNFTGILAILGAIILIGIIQAIIFKLKPFMSVIFTLILQGGIYFFIKLTSPYSILLHVFYSLLSLFFGMIFQLIIPAKEKTKKKNDPVWQLIIPVKRGKDIVFDNIKRGIAIFGAAGAGKTESGFVPIIKHMADYNFAGINYDYKDGELTEITNFFYQKNKIVTNYIVSPAHPEISHRLNPISPEYIPSMETVNELVRVFFANSGGKASSKGGGNFFQEVPEATLGAVIWRLKCDFPQFCTLPHAIAICLVKDPFELADFLKKNKESKIMAAPYLDSLAGQDQLAGVKASLSNEMRKFAFPSMFYILSGDEINLRLNNPKSLGLLNVMNKPGLDDTYAPFFSVIISSALNCMRERGMFPSLLLMDEGTTIMLNKFSRTPATLRSYNLGTVYAMQDKVLGSELQGDITTRAILANLSYQLIGKANDSESIKYYKQILSEVERKSTSKSYRQNDLISDNRITESTRLTSKYLNQDFSGLEQGQFIILADGQDRKVDIELIPFKREPLLIRNNVTEKVLQDNYHKILSEVEPLM